MMVRKGNVFPLEGCMGDITGEGNYRYYAFIYILHSISTLLGCVSEGRTSSYNLDTIKLHRTTSLKNEMEDHNPNEYSRLTDLKLYKYTYVHKEMERTAG